MIARNWKKGIYEGPPKRNRSHWLLLTPEETEKIPSGLRFHHFSEWEIGKDNPVEPHQHNGIEFYYILEGRGVMTIGKEEQAVGPGDMIYIPRGTEHSCRVLGSTPLLRALGIVLLLE